MTARINPGDLCLIVAANAGRECNIGATVRVVRPVPEEATKELGWEFAEASRLLRIKREQDGWDWMSASAEKPTHWVWLLDKHLMPIHPDADVMTQETLERLSI